MKQLQSNIDNRYLQLMSLLMSVNLEYELTDFEAKVLDEVCRFHIAKKLLNVSDLIKLDHLASPAKIHLTFKRLIKKKMISLGTNPEDERIRYVKPSLVGLRRLEKMTQACQQAS